MAGLTGNALGLCQQSGKIEFLYYSKIHSRYNIMVVLGRVKELSSSFNKSEVFESIKLNTIIQS